MVRGLEGWVAVGTPSVLDPKQLTHAGPEVQRYEEDSASPERFL